MSTNSTNKYSQEDLVEQLVQFHRHLQQWKEEYLKKNSNNTQSHSVESSEYETAESKKRKRKAASKSSNKRQANAKLESFKQDENERELRNSSQRVSKEAKEARKAERENTIKEKYE
ncbi:unnamed protein product [Rhizopus microsporus]